VQLVKVKLSSTLRSVMTNQSLISRSTVRDAAARIGEADHCQAGGAIALSAALAAGLGQATANSTLTEQPTTSVAVEAARHMQSFQARARAEFLRLADQDANAITEFVALREQGEALRGYELLCDGPRDLADLAIAAAQEMQTFRAHVGEGARDDLEFAVTLMTGAARAAMQLLDSNLRIWPLPELLQRYEPEVTRLIAVVDALEPKSRMRG
jgi:formiminotetrahydrofolate cyclodeaminase